MMSERERQDNEAKESMKVFLRTLIDPTTVAFWVMHDENKEKHNAR